MKVLVEYDTGHTFGPASSESTEAYKAALSRGAAFFLYPYCGYNLKMRVEHVPTGHTEVRDMQKEKTSGTNPPASSSR